MKLARIILESLPFSKIFKLIFSNKELRKEKMNGQKQKKPATIALTPFK
jgi:hypothetical protein